MIYGIDIISDFLFGYWMLSEEYTFAKFIVLLIVCCGIMVIHTVYAFSLSYIKRSLNILDELILLSLVLLLISSLDGNSW